MKRRYLSASLVENRRVGTLRSVFFRFGGLRFVKTVINRFHLLTPFEVKIIVKYNCEVGETAGGMKRIKRKEKAKWRSH